MHNRTDAAVPITDSPEQARRWLAAGERVVLVVAPEQAEVAARLMGAAPGKASLMVGEPGDPATWQAANEMAAELGARGSERPGEEAGR